MVTCSCSPIYSGGWGRRVAWTREVEVALSLDCATALQPRWQGQTLSQKKNNNFKKKGSSYLDVDYQYFRIFKKWGFWKTLGGINSISVFLRESISQDKLYYYIKTTFWQQQQFGPGTVTPVIPALWEAKAGRSPEVRSLRPAWPTLWHPISTKKIKN